MTERSFSMTPSGALNVDADLARLPAGSVPDMLGWQIRLPGQSGVLSLDPPEVPLALLPPGFSQAAGARLPAGKTLVLLRRDRQGVIDGQLAVYDGSTLAVYFDDTNRPEKLNLPATPFRITINQETTPAVAYWSDGVNRPRFWAIGQNISSVGDLNQQGEVRWYDIQYDQLGSGTLAQGHYKFTARMRSASRLSAPAMLSRSLPITATPLYVESPPEMGPSGVVTDRGFSVVVTKPDVRWAFIDLLVCYSADGKNWSDLSVVASQALTPNDISVTLWCRSLAGTGELVSLAGLSTYEQHILRSADMVMRNNKLIHANVVQGTPPAEGLAIGKPTMSVATAYYPMESVPPPDKLAISASQGNEVAKRTPLSRNLPTTTTIQRRRYIDRDGQPVYRTYSVTSEALDYSGPQFIQAFGDWRAGETYPVGILWFDLLGQGAFVQRLGYYTVPELWTGETGLMRINGQGVTEVQHIGLRLDNIQLDAARLRDANGKLIVSGFAIVRGDPSGKLGAQGLLLNTCQEVYVGSSARNDTFSALPAWQNNFADAVGNSSVLLPQPMVKGPDTVTQIGRYGIEGKFLTFHAPDLLADPGGLDATPASTYIQVQGSVLTRKNDHQGVDVEATGSGWHDYILRANFYNPLTTRPTAQSRAKSGEHAQVKASWSLPQDGDPELIEHIDPANDHRNFSAFAYPILTHPYTNRTILGQARVGQGKLLAVDRRFLVDAGLTADFPVGYAVASLENRVEAVPTDAIRYQSTGHYQPVDEAFLASLPQATIDSKLVYVVNGLETFGGNIQRQRVGIALMAHLYTPDGQQISSPLVNNSQPFDPDYGIGVITVLENEYNQQLRGPGRRWETTGWTPQKQAYRGEVPWMDGGVSSYQREDWNVNEGLKAGTPGVSYRALPVNASVRNAWPQGIAWSRLKTDSERYDSFLRYPAENLYLLDGEGGPIWALMAMPYGLYALQADCINAVQVDEREVTGPDTGTGLTIATGREVGPHFPLSKTTGIDRWINAWEGDKAFYWLDRRTAHLYRFTQAGIDDVSHLFGGNRLFQSTDLPLMQGIYDTDRKVCLIRRGNRLLVFDEELNQFGSPLVHAGGWLFPGHDGTLTQLPGVPPVDGVIGTGGNSVPPPVPVPLVVVPLPVYVPVPVPVPQVQDRLVRVGTTYPSMAMVRLISCPYPGQWLRWVRVQVPVTPTLADQLASVVLRCQNRGRTIERSVGWWSYRHGQLWIPLADMEAADGDEEISLTGAILEVELTFSIGVYSPDCSLLSATFVAYISTRI